MSLSIPVLLLVVHAEGAPPGDATWDVALDETSWSLQDRMTVPLESPLGLPTSAMRGDVLVVALDELAKGASDQRPLEVRAAPGADWAVVQATLATAEAAGWQRACVSTSDRRACVDLSNRHVLDKEGAVILRGTERVLVQDGDVVAAPALVPPSPPGEARPLPVIVGPTSTAADTVVKALTELEASDRPVHLQTCHLSGATTAKAPDGDDPPTVLVLPPQSTRPAFSRGAVVWHERFAGLRASDGQTAWCLPDVAYEHKVELQLTNTDEGTVWGTLLPVHLAPEHGRNWLWSADNGIEAYGPRDGCLVEPVPSGSFVFAALRDCQPSNQRPKALPLRGFQLYQRDGQLARTLAVPVEGMTRWETTALDDGWVALRVDGDGWVHDGERWAKTCTDCRVLALDAARRRLAYRDLTDGSDATWHVTTPEGEPLFHGTDDTHAAGFAPDGRLALAGPEAVVLSVEGKRLLELGAQSASGLDSVRWSPEGKRLLMGASLYVWGTPEATPFSFQPWQRWPSTGPTARVVLQGEPGKVYAVHVGRDARVATADGAGRAVVDGVPYGDWAVTTGPNPWDPRWRRANYPIRAPEVTLTLD